MHQIICFRWHLFDGIYVRIIFADAAASADFVGSEESPAKICN